MTRCLCIRRRSDGGDDKEKGLNEAGTGPSDSVHFREFAVRLKYRANQPMRGCGLLFRGSAAISAEIFPDTSYQEEQNGD